jgi:FkbM family methyltransferase
MLPMFTRVHSFSKWFDMKRLIKNALVKLTQGFIGLFGDRWRKNVTRVLREAMASKSFEEVIIDAKTPSGDIRFYCLGHLAEWRAETLLTKEPETIDWLDTMEEGEVLYDIGANVGAYSLYAGVCRKVRVLAFEPSAANYFLLNRNIEENDLSGQVTAFCLAMSDENAAGTLHMQDTGFGSALSSFGEPVDYLGNQFKAKFEQGMLGFSLDAFIELFNPDFPNHIKIDVDGIEDKIVDGAIKTLSDPRLKSASIELDDSREEYTNGVIAQVEKCGLIFASKLRIEELDGTPYESIYNYRFVRKT